MKYQKLYGIKAESYTRISDDISEVKIKVRMSSVSIHSKKLKVFLG